MALRYGGQEATMSLVDSTTGDQLLPDMNIESVNVTFPYELVEKNFIGQVGPDYREFGKGYEVSFKFEHNNPAQTIDFVQRLQAKAEGKSNDEFALAFKLIGIDQGNFRVILRDLHFEGVPLDMGSRTDLLTTEIKAKGKIYKIQTA